MTQTWEDMRGDIIDSRDIIERLEELEADEDRTEDETAELGILRDFADEGSQVSADWQYGEAFIPEHRFVEYAQELAEDIGAIPTDAQWPCTCIDWAEAARELKMDYSSVEVDGETYWGRS